MSQALDVIHRDHLNLDKVLRALSTAVKALEDHTGTGTPDFDLLYQIVYYIRVFPDRIHHPKEEKYLFSALAAHGDETRTLIERLQAQHNEGDRRITTLDSALKSCATNFPDGVADLRNAADAYIAFQRDHIGLEERELLPKAQETLTKDDWRLIDRAFASDTDPLFGENLETGFRVLFEHITAAEGAAAP